ncbi:MAG: NfeD family protein [Leptolyngbyaceae cyanobacterium MO_188.B28]|nr:NfeD family protein [Leptolyngbyaceae cyanobacterium MO_188.B28]
MTLSPVLELSEFSNFAPVKTTARVEKTISPSCRGRVYFQATYWPARFYQPDCQATVLPGDSVTIIGRQGLTLLVRPKRANS